MPETTDAYTPSGSTRAFAVLGHPVRHTLSPRMHNPALRAMGMDAVYLAFDVQPGTLREALHGMRALGFGGVNITVPLKVEALEAVDALDPSAELLGAVNTVVFTEQGLVGHNTDGAGFLTAFEEAFDQPVTGLNLFVLGTGGAGRAVALMSASKGAAGLQLADMDAARAERTANEIRTQFPKVALSVCTRPDDWTRQAAHADAVIQATPVGMHEGDDSPLPPQAFRPGSLAFDLIYMFPETPFTTAAKAGGAKTSNGLGMLLHQGARALALWTGQEPPIEIMRKALADAVYGP